MYTCINRYWEGIPDTILLGNYNLYPYISNHIYIYIFIYILSFNSLIVIIQISNYCQYHENTKYNLKMYVQAEVMDIPYDTYDHDLSVLFQAQGFFFTAMQQHFGICLDRYISLIKIFSLLFSPHYQIFTWAFQ